MLCTGRYPLYLRNRITGPKGHMCNDETARVLSENIPNDMKHIWLCHLSAENNTPELALRTTQLALEEKGFIINKEGGIKLEALKRTECSGTYSLE